MSVADFMHGFLANSLANFVPDVVLRFMHTPLPSCLSA